MKQGRALALIALAVLMAACGNPADLGDAVRLAGSEWVLVSLSGRPLAKDTYLTLNFAELALDGNAGCNSYGADYRIVGNEMQVGLMNSTVQLCLEPEGVMEQESLYLDALRRTATFRLAGAELVLLNGTGEEMLVYARWLSQPINPLALVGTAWRLIAVDDVSPLDGTTISLSFDVEGLLSGNGGCRPFSGRYEAEGDRFRLRMLTMDDTTCPRPETVQVQEAEFTTHLEQVIHYRLSDGLLEMLTVRGKTLRFAATP